LLISACAIIDRILQIIVRRRDRNGGGGPAPPPGSRLNIKRAIDNTNRKATTTKRPAPQRSRSHRERRGDTARKPVLHVVMPGMEVARAEIKPRETIAAFLRRTGWATKDKIYGWQ
jgi:hypothetical protein